MKLKKNGCFLGKIPQKCGSLILAFLMTACLEGCATAEPPETTAGETEPAAAVTTAPGEETVPAPSEALTAVAAVPAPKIPTLPREAPEDVFAMALTVTGDSSSMADYRYLVPEDQAGFRAAYERAVSEAADSALWQQTGWNILCDGQLWGAAEDGTFLQPDREILPEDAAELMALCKGELRKAGIPEPVKPEQLKGIQRATLRWMDTATALEPEYLPRLEQWLTEAQPISSPNCWFTATLTLELEDGRQETLAMATDSCCIYLSQGMPYRYGSGDNAMLYSLFAGKLLHENQDLPREALEVLEPLVDLKAYEEKYGPKEAEALHQRLYPMGGPVVQTQAQIDQGIRIRELPGTYGLAECADGTEAENPEQRPMGVVSGDSDGLPVTMVPGDGMLPMGICMEFPFCQPGENLVLSRNAAFLVPEGTELQILVRQEEFYPVDLDLEFGLCNVDTGACYSQSMTRYWAVEDVVYRFPDLPGGTYRLCVWNQDRRPLESGSMLLRLLP